MEVATTQTVIPLSMVDTNVFVYFLYDASPQYPAAQALLNQARQPDARLCITPQVMTELQPIIPLRLAVCEWRATLAERGSEAQ